MRPAPRALAASALLAVSVVLAYLPVRHNGYRLATTYLGMGDPNAAHREYLLLRTTAPPMAAELLRFIEASLRMKHR